MAPETKWRYILGTFLLVVAVCIAVAAMFGVTAEASTFEVEFRGTKIKGSSIVVLAIVVFVFAGLVLLGARTRTPTLQPRQQNRDPNTGRFLRFMGGVVSEFEVVPYPQGIWLRRVYAAAIIAGGILMLVATGVTTRVGI